MAWARTTSGRPPPVATPPRVADRDAGTHRAAHRARSDRGGPSTRGGARWRSPPSRGPRTRRSAPTASRAPSASSSRAATIASASSASDGPRSGVGSAPRDGSKRRPMPLIERPPRRGTRAAGVRPRWRWVLTVPSGRPVWRAISSRLISPKKRNVTTSRYGSASAGDRSPDVRRPFGTERERATGRARARPRSRPGPWPRLIGSVRAGRASCPTGSRQATVLRLARPGAGRCGRRCASATHRTVPPRASSPASDTRSRTPPGQRPRPRGGRRGSDGTPGRPGPTRARRGGGRPRDRPPGRRRRWRGRVAGEVIGRSGSGSAVRDGRPPCVMVRVCRRTQAVGPSP